MTAAQPPAGWYADPSGGSSAERWWDGAAWTEHRRAQGASIPPAAAPPLTFAAPWSNEPASGARSRKPLLIGLGVAGVAIIAVAAAVTGAKGSDSTSAMQTDIMTTGQSQLQAALANLAPGATVAMDDANCVKTAGTQDYTCLVHYTVSEAGNEQKFLLHVSGTCASGGDCQWHAEGDGVPVP